MTTSVPPPRLHRRAAVATVVGATVLLVGLAWWLVPWQWVPGGHLVPARAADLLTARQMARGEAYSGTVRPLSWAATGVQLLLLLVLGLTPLGARLARRVAGRRRWWLAVPPAVLVVEVLASLVTLPFGLLVRRQQLRYGLTEQGLGGWLRDRGVSLLVAWVVATVLVMVVVGLARRAPRWWFAWAAGAVAVLGFALSVLYPVVVEPLFNRFTPLPDGPLRTEILRLADEEGVPVREVLVADASRRTTTLNAYVSGLGSTRRVVLYDTLLHGTPRREVESVVAHELGHAAHHDVLLGTSLGVVGAVAGVGLLALLLDSRRLRRWSGTHGPGDPAVAALVLALVAAGTFLASPAENVVSRAIEARADRAAIETTRDPEAFVDLQRSLAVRALADPTPVTWSQLWFGTHPTFLQRAGLPASLAAADR